MFLVLFDGCVILTNAIVIQCKCEKKLRLSKQWAGKSVKCPACQRQIRVPGAKQAGGNAVEVMDSLLDEIGFQQSAAANRCPECREVLPEEAVLCVHCGYNLETGKQLQTKLVGKRGAKQNKGKPDDEEGSAKGGCESTSPVVRVAIALAVVMVVGLIVIAALGMMSSAG